MEENLKIEINNNINGGLVNDEKIVLCNTGGYLAIHVISYIGITFKFHENF
ncbi:hypothetical protein U3516DRAFT_760673 [Neocallimastix sp. 'constans']